MSVEPSDKVAARISLDITPAQQQLAQLSKDLNTAFDSLPKSDGLAQLEKSIQSANKELSSVKKQLLNNDSGKTFLQNAQGQLVSFRDELKNIQLQFKEGQLEAQNYIDKLNGLRQSYAPDFSSSNPNSIKNDLSLRSAIQQAQQEISKMQDFELQSERQSAQQTAQIQAENIQRTEKQKADSINNQLRMIKEFYNMELDTAKESLQKLEALMNEEAAYFEQNEMKKIDAMKLGYKLRNDIEAQQAEIAKKLAPVPSSGSQTLFSQMTSSGHSHSMGIVDMAGMEAQFMAMNAVFNNIQQGIVEIDKGAAGLNQVFGENTQTQEQLNQVTNQFIGIAKEYGATVQDVMDAGKLWGRQYKDVETALTLTRNATVLATVDNLSMADSNRAVEATMNAFAMSARNAAEANASSMKIVDSWSALAHEASVSAKDLADGVERSAGAAKQAGVSFDQLNALVTVSVRNTGLPGANLGNAWKTMLTNISTATPKVQEAFDKLGISMFTVGQNGQKQLKPVWDLILELSQATQHASASDAQWFKAISGGVMQVSKLESALRNTDEIVKVYNESMNSSGKANQLVQDQMHTIQAELTRLSDTIQEVAHNAETSGLGAVFKTAVVDLTNLIQGLQQLPASVDYGAVAFIGLMVTLKTMGSLIGGIRNTIQNLGSVWTFLTAASAQVSNALNAQSAAQQRLQAATLATTETEGVQAAESAATVGALEAETVAATEATAAFSALDVVSGGLALVIGAAVTGLTAWTMHLGESKQQADLTSQSVQDLNNSLTQMSMQSQANLTQTTQNINSLQDLKTRYEQVKTSLDTATQGSAAYKEAETQMEDIHRQLIALVGEKAAAQIMSSKNINGAINSEIQTLLNLQTTEQTEAIKKAEAEKTKTDNTIAQVKARIDAYNTEAEVQARLANEYYQKSQDALRNGDTVSYDVDKRQMQIHSSYAEGNREQYDKEQENYDKLKAQSDGYKKTIDDLNNALSETKKMAEELKKSPDIKFRVPSSPYGDGGTNMDYTGAGTSSKNQYKDYVNELKNNLDSYTNANKQLDSAISIINNKLGINTDLLKYGAANSNLAAQATDLYKEKVHALSTQQDSLHATNDQIRADMASIEKQIYALNPSGADTSSLDQGRQDAINSLSQEYDQLSQQLNQNGQKWWDNEKQMTQATIDWVGALTQAQDNGLKPLDTQLKQSDRDLQTVQSHMKLLSDELKHGADATKVMTDYTKDFDQQIKLVAESNKTLSEQNSRLSANNADLQTKQSDLLHLYDSGKITLEAYTAGYSALNDKIQSNSDLIAQNTQKLNDNIIAMRADVDAMNQMNFDNADNSIKSILENLKDMSSEIDKQIAAFDYQNQVDDNNAKLAELQQEAEQWRNSTSVEGRQKYQDYMKQITDLQTQMSRDAKKNDLEQQKQHIQDLIDIYSNFTNNAESINDTLQQTLQASAQETSSKIKGYLDEISQKLKDLQTQESQATQQMITQLNQVILQAKAAYAIAEATGNQAAMNAAAAAAESAREAGGTIGANQTTGQVIGQADNSTLMAIIQNAGQAWSSASSQSTKNSIHDTLYNQLQGSGATYNDSTGVWVSKDGTVLNGSKAGQKLPGYKDGGWIDQDQIAMLHGQEDVIGQKLTAQTISRYGMRPSDLLMNLPNLSTPKFTMQNTPKIEQHFHLERAFDGAVFRNKGDIDYGVKKLTVELERGTSFRQRAAGMR